MIFLNLFEFCTTQSCCKCLVFFFLY